MPNNYHDSWRHLITRALDKNNETWGDVVDHTLDDSELDRRFNTVSDIAEGTPFTLWTSNRVYFPTFAINDTEGVGSVSRNPDGLETNHIGG